MRFTASVGAALALTCAVGCASSVVPPQQPAAILYGDLQRLVSVEAASGWNIDRLEVEGLLASALVSVCQSSTDAQLDLAAWLEGQIAGAGGPVDEAWRRAGKKSGAISELIELDRVYKLLSRSIEASANDCPYWTSPSDAFAGRQISFSRWQLSLGGGGKGIAVRQGDRTDLNFGGAGRALLGRTFGTHHALYAGLEVGASASFPRAEDGAERGALLVGFDVVAPVVYRYTYVNAYLEAEVGYLSHFTEDNLVDIAQGLHVGVAIGGRATRARLLFPGAALGLSIERTFGNVGDEPPLLAVKLGFRVALDWDL